MTRSTSAGRGGPARSRQPVPGDIVVFDSELSGRSAPSETCEYSAADPRRAHPGTAQERDRVGGVPYRVEADRLVPTDAPERMIPLLFSTLDPVVGVHLQALECPPAPMLLNMPAPAIMWEGMATVLFADLRNFTGMVEYREPSAVFALLNSVHRVLIAAIQEWGGVVDKFLGDGLMATFGEGTDLGNHAEQAVHAAIAMQRRLKVLAPAFAQDGWPCVGIGVGLASGRMVAGYVGVPGCVDYTVVGDTVNVASRLTAGAKEGEVVLDEGTYSRVTEWLAAEPLGEIQMRGRAQPVLAWQVRGA